jgi:NAD(P)-dependent dehydrogenase (short-subunit alcohol dehydrogenase family)
MSKTWLVTGCSSGLGRAIVEEVLADGQKAVVTARDLDRARQIATCGGDRALPLALDVTDPRSIDAACMAAAHWNQVDVLVNNAAYGLYGAVEEADDDEIVRLFETNFLGTLRMIRTVLPGMRARGSGTIINIGSIAGLIGRAGTGLYAATKFALEGLSEALEAELKPLGIRVILLEPSGIRTDFQGRSHRRTRRRIDVYAETAGRQIDSNLGFDKRQAGDPHRIARMLIRLVETNETPFRLLAGASAVDRARAKLTHMQQQIDRWETLSRSTDFDEATSS